MEVDTVVREEEWFFEAIMKYIDDYYAKHESPPDWNLIHAGNREQSSVSFRRENYDLFVRPIIRNVRYGRQPTDILPTIPFDKVKQKFVLVFPMIAACGTTSSAC